MHVEEVNPLHLAGLEFHYVSDMMDVLEFALDTKFEGRPQKK